MTYHCTAGLANPVTVAANCCGCSSITVTPLGVTATPTCVITCVIVLADLLGSAALVAVIVMLFGCGAAPGVVNSPELKMVPQGLFAPAQPGPLTLQFIAVLGFDPGTSVSRALICAVADGFTLAGPLTASANWLVTATLTFFIFEGSASLVAVIITFAGEGKTCGAVNNPAAVIVPHAPPAQFAPPTLQVTVPSGFPEPVTCAMKACIAPSSTLGIAGKIDTATSLVIVTFASAKPVGSAWLTALTATGAEVITRGAV